MKLNLFKKWHFGLFLMSLSSVLMVKAQTSSKSLSLEEAVQAATQNNKQVVIAQTDAAIAASNFKQTEAIWLPQVNLSHTAFSTNNPLNVFGFKLQQAGVQQSDFNPTLLNNPSTFSHYSTQLAVQQPILNMDAIYMRKAAKMQMGLYDAQVQRTVEAIKMQVVQAYLLLEFSYQYELVAKEGLNTIQAIYKFTKDRFDQGMMQKSDLLNVEVQVKAALLQNSQAKSQIENVSDQLSLLIGMPKGIVYTTKPYQLIKVNMVADSVSLGRSDIRALTAAVNSYDVAIKSTKMGWAPKLNGFANYNINDKSMTIDGAKSYIAGLQLSWDIFKGNQIKNKSNTQRLEKVKVQEQLNNQVENANAEIRKTNRAIIDANNKIEQSVIAVQQAQEALRIIQNRYEQGLISTNDVLVAQTQLLQQKLLLAQAEFEKKSNINYLDFLTTK